jgi:NAD(P)-dependent dehydrogenase (short-subunit alcohol dehydrogenase family)
MRAMVTGASRGLGLALCRVLADRGDEVLAVCRKRTPGLAELDVSPLDGFDLSDGAGMAGLGDAIGSEPLDVVICNAGVNLTYAAGIEVLDVAALTREFGVNTFGAIRTVQAALPRLREGSKIALISTWRPGVGAAKRNYGYQMSKVATNQFAFLLADDLAPHGIATILLSPGPMDTALLREVAEAGHANLDPSQAQDPADVARDLIGHIDALTLETTGSWLFRSGEPMGELATSAVYGH